MHNWKGYIVCNEVHVNLNDSILCDNFHILYMLQVKDGHMLSEGADVLQHMIDHFLLQNSYIVLIQRELTVDIYVNDAGVLDSTSWLLTQVIVIDVYHIKNIYVYIITIIKYFSLNCLRLYITRPFVDTTTVTFLLKCIYFIFVMCFSAFMLDFSRKYKLRFCC